MHVASLGVMLMFALILMSLRLCMRMLVLGNGPLGMPRANQARSATRNAAHALECTGHGLLHPAHGNIDALQPGLHPLLHPGHASHVHHTHGLHADPLHADSLDILHTHALHALDTHLGAATASAGGGALYTLDALDCPANAAHANHGHRQHIEVGVHVGGKHLGLMLPVLGAMLGGVLLLGQRVQ